MVEKIQLKNKTDRELIEKTFGVTSASVSQALNFRRNSPNAKKIRAMALKLGGKYLKESESKEEIKILTSKGEVKKIITI